MPPYLRGYEQSYGNGDASIHPGGQRGLDRVALLSNNPDKAAQLDRLTVAERVPIAVHLNATSARYLATKTGRGAHAGPPVR